MILRAALEARLRDRALGSVRGAGARLLRAVRRAPILQEIVARARNALASGAVGGIVAAAQALLRDGRDVEPARRLAVARAVSVLMAVARVMARRRRFLQAIALPQA